jgi:hypothetical protein
VRSDAQQGSVCNSVFLRQTAPRTNVTAAGNVDADGSVDVFVLAPSALTTVSAVTNGTLTVAGNAGFAVGTRVTAADDERALLVAQSNAATLVLDQAPAAFTAPGMLFGYPSTSVVDDPRLAVTSPALAVGLAPIGTTAPDAGPLGASAGGVPGRFEPYAAPSMRLLRVTPSLATGGSALTPIVLTFDRAVAPASVTSDRVVVQQNGTPIVVNLSVAGTELTVAPTAPLSGTVTLRLLHGLAAADGSTLASTVLAPIRIL